MDTHLRLPQRTTVASMIASGMLLTMIGAAPARADDPDVTPPVAPQLSIRISDERDTTDAGETLDYVIQVENIGSTDALGLVVTQSVPAGMTSGSADSSGSLTGSVVSWTLDVQAAQTASLSTTMTVGDTPEDLLRLATVACAQASTTDPPIVCASDSDLLPAGAVVAESDETPDGGTTVAVWWVAGGASALVAALAVLTLVFVRRRRSAGRTLGPHSPSSTGAQEP